MAEMVSVPLKNLLMKTREMLSQSAVLKKMNTYIYQVEGDVTSVVLKEDYSYITIIDNHDKRQELSIRTLPLRPEAKEDLKDKRIIVEGNLYITNKFSLGMNKVKSIRIKGDCSRVEQIKEWYSECEAVLETEREIDVLISLLTV